MIKILKVIGILGFAICLFIMYKTEHGIPAIQKYDPSFRLLDMRFHYSSEDVLQTFVKIGQGGHIAYQRFLVLDFIFIVCFLTVMFSVTDALITCPVIRSIVYAVCILRALFDIVENILLLVMLSRFPIFNDMLANICSWFTTLKFIMLYIWIFVIIAQLVMLGINRFNRIHR